jgi:hypothetical protein
MGAKSKTGLSLFNPLSYYHQHHHHFHHPDGVPEEEWCDEYGVSCFSLYKFYLPGGL